MDANNLNPTQYVDAVNAIYKESYDKAIELLKTLGDNCFVAYPDYEDEFTAHSGDAYDVSIIAVGLNENRDGIIVMGYACNYMSHDEEGYFPDEWVDAGTLEEFCYPDMYRFVAAGLDKAVSKEEAEEIFNSYDEEF